MKVPPVVPASERPEALAGLAATRQSLHLKEFLSMCSLVLGRWVSMMPTKWNSTEMEAT